MKANFFSSALSNYRTTANSIVPPSHIPAQTVTLLARVPNLSLALPIHYYRQHSADGKWYTPQVKLAPQQLTFSCIAYSDVLLLDGKNIN